MPSFCSVNPEHTMTESDFSGFERELAATFPTDRLIDDPLRRLAYGTDASFYRLIPRLVVQVESIEELQRLLRAAQQFRIAVTFRAAGTSLSGQAVTDSVLVSLGRNWQTCDILDAGAAIRMQPGVIGANANALLSPLKRRIGPDPASINTAKIGGIAANNASGMCCGTAYNSYQTLRSMKLVLADGSLLDTGDDLSRDMFSQSQGALLQTLAGLAHGVRENPALCALIRRKYRLKNTTGYGINALLDFTDPIDILQHLMIGSEGTLGFIAEISLDTIAEEPHKATGLLVFCSLEEACRAVTQLESQPVSAVELIDRKGLAAVAHMDGMPPDAVSFPAGATALLIEVTGDSEHLLRERLDAITRLATGWDLLEAAKFSTDPQLAEQLWAIRKGMFPAVGAVRDTGTTVIIEDVAFPVDSLAAGVSALHSLLEQHGYHEAVMFGHALQGNLHFVFTQSFEQPEEIARYGRFMDALAQLVAVEHQGSLKAEHGTGRNMAPYVELEWGSEAYQVMLEIKALLDPAGILNPGVVLNPDPTVHLKQLKPMPAANELVDRCIECGFCEPACPSRDLSLTPRQRIASWREIHRLEQLGDQDSLDQRKALLQAYQFNGADSCAACGLCELRCPVNINTGDLTRAIRADQNHRWHWLAQAIARHFGLVVSAARIGLRLVDSLANMLGRQRFGKFTQSLHSFSRGTVPLWRTPLSGGSKPGALHSEGEPENTVIYFPACPGRMMDADLSTTITELLQRAGFEVIIPPGVDSECCGMPFASKGFPDIAQNKGNALWALLEKSRNGKPIPCISDASPCSQQLAHLPGETVDVQDSVSFLHEHVLPRLTIHQRAECIAVHVTCSSQRMGTGKALRALAEACSEDVVVPDEVTCCGFAGDKGFTLPELNASALQGLADEIPTDCHAGYSNSRTCEIGLSDHAGIPYRHIAYLLLEASSPEPV
jgi:D-lactate dehydrogenase